IDGVIALPFCSRVATIYGFGPIKTRIAFRHRAVVEVKRIALAVCVHHVPKEHIQRRYCSFECGQRVSLCHVVPFAQPSVRLKLCHSNRKWFAVACCHDWTVMRLAHRELASLDTSRGLDAYFLDALGGHSITSPIFVGEWASSIIERFNVNICQIGRVVSADPATVVVVPNVWQRKSKSCVTSKVPSFVAMNVSFINLAGTKERQVRIDEK